MNTALSMLDCCEPVFRLPYVPYDDHMRQGLADIACHVIFFKFKRQVLNVHWMTWAWQILLATL